ncbi:MAG TPA: H-type lectin domain-containing protein [Pyrinomonadaceae bacterium]|nr:H-type lectin domain-containing protein [Pyrinomonadaceae bacterium]
MRIENGKYSADESHERWSLSESGLSRQRTFTSEITFAQPFETPPKVIIAISGFDIFDSGETFSSSVKVRAESITTQGFTVRFSAYETSRVRGLTVDWLAIGA